MLYGSLNSLTLLTKNYGIMIIGWKWNRITSLLYVRIFTLAQSSTSDATKGDIQYRFWQDLTSFFKFYNDTSLPGRCPTMLQQYSVTSLVGKRPTMLQQYSVTSLVGK